MTASALAGRLVTAAGILDDGVLEVRPDGTIGYVGPASDWSGSIPRPVGTIAPGFVDIHCHGGGGHSVTSRDPDEVAAVAAHHLPRGTTTMLASLVSASPPDLVAAIRAIESVASTGSPTTAILRAVPATNVESRAAARSKTRSPITRPKIRTRGRWSRDLERGPASPTTARAARRFRDRMPERDPLAPQSCAG